MATGSNKTLETLFNLFTNTVTPVPQPKTTTPEDLFGDYVNPPTMPPPGIGGDYFDPLNPPIEDPLQMAVAMFATGYKQFLGVPDNMRDMANYMNQMRICFILLTLLGYIGTIVFFVMWNQANREERRRQKRRSSAEDAEEVESLTSTHVNKVGNLRRSTSKQEINSSIGDQVEKKVAFDAMIANESQDYV